MIGSIYTAIERDTWTTVPGRAIRPAYDDNGRIIRQAYLINNEVSFVKHFSYNEDGKITLISCDTNDE